MATARLGQRHFHPGTANSMTIMWADMHVRANPSDDIVANRQRYFDPDAS
jgi:hypothetical protein